MRSAALLIDTSTRHLIAGRIAAQGTKLLCSEPSVVGEDALDSAIEQLFPNLDAIGEVYLGAGPGSFVGLRSAFAYVRMLSMLRTIPCRTFYSSLLWRILLDVPLDQWLLMRTNAKMYYAERFVPQREAKVVITNEASILDGKKYCYAESWQARARTQNDLALPADWQRVFFSSDDLAQKKIIPEQLRLSAIKPHSALLPLYGHELNFTLAKGPYG